MAIRRTKAHRAKAQAARLTHSERLATQYTWRSTASSSVTSNNAKLAEAQPSNQTFSTDSVHKLIGFDPRTIQRDLLKTIAVSVIVFAFLIGVKIYAQ